MKNQRAQETIKFGFTRSLIGGVGVLFALSLALPTLAQAIEESTWAKDAVFSTDATLTFSAPSSLVEITAEPQEVPLKIRLLDADGKPLVGVQIFLTSGNSYFGDASKVEPEVVTTDEQGQAEATYLALPPEDIMDLYATCRTSQGNTLHAQLTLIKDDPTRTDNKTIEFLVSIMKQPPIPAEEETLLGRVKQALGLKEKSETDKSAKSFSGAASQFAEEQSQITEGIKPEETIDLTLSADSTKLPKEFIGTKNFNIATSPATQGIVKLSLAGDKNITVNTPQVTLSSSGQGSGSFRIFSPGVRTFTVNASFSLIRQQDEGVYGTASLTFIQGLTEADKEEQKEMKDSLEAYLEWARKSGLVLAEETDGIRVLRVTSEKRTGVKSTGAWGGILKPVFSQFKSTILDLALYNTPSDTYLPLRVAVLENNQPILNAEVEISVDNRLRTATTDRLSGINSVASENYAGGRFYPTQIKPTTSLDGSLNFVFYAGPTSAKEATLHLTHAYLNEGELSQIRTEVKFPILHGEGAEVDKIEDPIILEAHKPGEDPDRAGDPTQNEIARIQNVWTIHVGLKRELDEIENIKTLSLTGNGKFGPTKSRLLQTEPPSDNSPWQPFQPSPPPQPPGDLLTGGDLIIKLEHDKPNTPEIEGDLEPEKDYAIVTFTPGGVSAYVTARILPGQTTAKNINYTKTIWLNKISVSKKAEEKKKVEEPKEVNKYGIKVIVTAQKNQVKTDGKDQTILDIKIDPTEGSQSGKIKKSGNSMLVYLEYRGPRGNITYLEQSGNRVYNGFVGDSKRLIGSLTGADPSRLFQVRNDRPSEINLRIRYSALKTGDKVQDLTINTPSEYWVWVYYQYGGKDAEVKSNIITITKLAASPQPPEQLETPLPPGEEQPTPPEEPGEPEQPPAQPPGNVNQQLNSLLNQIDKSSSFSSAERKEVTDLVNQYKEGKIDSNQLITRLDRIAGQKSESARELLFGNLGNILIDQLLTDMKNSGEYSEEDLEDAYRAGQEAKDGNQEALRKLEKVFDRRQYTKFWWEHEKDFNRISSSFSYGYELGKPPADSGSGSEGTGSSLTPSTISQQISALWQEFTQGISGALAGGSEQQTSAPRINLWELIWNKLVSLFK